MKSLTFIVDGIFLTRCNIPGSPHRCPTAICSKPNPLKTCTACLIGQLGHTSGIAEILLEACAQHRKPGGNTLYLGSCVWNLHFFWNGRPESCPSATCEVCFFRVEGKRRACVCEKDVRGRNVSRQIQTSCLVSKRCVRTIHGFSWRSSLSNMHRICQNGLKISSASHTIIVVGTMRRWCFLCVGHFCMLLSHHPLVSIMMGFLDQVVDIVTCVRGIVLACEAEAAHFALELFDVLRSVAGIGEFNAKEYIWACVPLALLKVSPIGPCRYCCGKPVLLPKD